MGLCRVLSFGFVLAVTVLCGCRRASDPDVVARELECRVLSPCCYRETVADHDSDLAGALRREITARVRAGEPAELIEADLVRRYGAGVRALPPGRDPRWVVELVPGVALLVGLGALVRVRRRTRTHEVAAVAPVGELGYADRLDDELRDFD